MTASGNPALEKRLQQRNLVSLFLATVADRGDHIAVRDSDGRVEFSYADLAAKTARVAAGLAKLGVQRGDMIALMMVNRPEFFAVDMAALSLGATPFSLYNTSPAVQLVDVLRDADVKVAFCDRAFVPVLAEARRLGAPLQTVIVIDGDDAAGATTTLVRLERTGGDFDLAAAANDVDPQAIATLIYTSGSTGLPKGVELTHANLVAQVTAISQTVLQIDDGSYISVLPPAHSADRTRSYYGTIVAFGHTLTTVAAATDLPAVMRSVRPVYFGNVPRAWEKIRAGIHDRWGADAADRAARDPGIGEEVRASLGLDRVRWIASGSAPTQPGQFEFFDAFGIRICELWGMSETCALAATNTPDHCRFGTVGRPMNGVEMKRGDDGELLVRGPTVAKRYRNRPEETAAAFDSDGWLHTGDLAEADADGYWRITGRKKELIINAAGQNMSPNNIEGALKSAGPVIMQACVIGDLKPYNIALIVVSGAYAGHTDEDLDAEVAAAVATANAQLARVEQIKKFAVFREEWLPGGDEMTPTMKLKRREIAAKYQAVIDGLYV